MRGFKSIRQIYESRRARREPKRFGENIREQESEFICNGALRKKNPQNFLLLRALKKSCGTLGLLRYTLVCAYVFMELEMKCQK